MPKTFSQKIARAFELLGYLYFLSSGLLLLTAGFQPWLLSLQLFTGFLLGGFILHSRGLLETRWFGLLWIANFIFYLIFTLVFALFSLWAMAWIIGTKSPDVWKSVLVLLLIGAALLTAIIFSFIGLAAHTEENGKIQRAKLS